MTSLISVTGANDEDDVDFTEAELLLRELGVAPIHSGLNDDSGANDAIALMTAAYRLRERDVARDV